MKKSEFKNIIKEALREVLDEVMVVNAKEIKSINENIESPPHRLDLESLRDSMKNTVLEGRKVGTDSLIITSTDTMSEGSRLPEGNVSDDLIQKLMNGGL